MASRARSRIIEDPAKAVQGWAFLISRSHLTSIGISQRTFVRNKAPYIAWARDIPPRPSFNEGDIFYKAGQPVPRSCLQVVAVTGQQLDVHLVGLAAPGRRGYRISESELLQWLEFGVDTTNHVQLQRGEGRGGIFSWLLDLHETGGRNEP